MAAQNNSNLKSAIAKAGIVIARSTFMPSLNVTATQGQRGTSLFPRNDYWAVGMNLTFPFFTGEKDYYTMLSAYSTNTSAKENRENINQQILVTLAQSYNSSDIARNKYNNALLMFDAWDVIETNLINRQKSYLLSKLNRVTYEAAREQAQEKGVFQ